MHDSLLREGGEGHIHRRIQCNSLSERFEIEHEMPSCFQTGHEDWNKGQTSLRDGLYEESLSCNFSWTHPYPCRSPWALQLFTKLLCYSHHPWQCWRYMLVPLHMFPSFPSVGFGSIPRKRNWCQDSILHHCWMFFCALNRGSWNISVRWSNVQKDEELPPRLCLSVPSTGGLWLAFRFCIACLPLSPTISWIPTAHLRQCAVYEKWGRTQGLVLQHHLQQPERLPEGLRAHGLQSEDEKAKGWDIFTHFSATCASMSGVNLLHGGMIVCHWHVYSSSKDIYIYI